MLSNNLCVLDVIGGKKLVFNKYWPIPVLIVNNRKNYIDILNNPRNRKILLNYKIQFTDEDEEQLCIEKEYNKYAKHVNSLIFDQIGITFGNACNFNCSYCICSNSDKESVNVDEILKTISYLFENLNTSNNIISVHITGGEPLLHYKKIEKIVSTVN